MFFRSRSENEMLQKANNTHRETEIEEAFFLYFLRLNHDVDRIILINSNYKINRFYQLY